MIYGYARVSTTSQKIDRQIVEFNKLNIDPKNIYIDYQSGKDFKRASYQKLKKKLKKGDTLYIKSVDRLGRDYDMIIDEWREIVKKLGVDLMLIDMPNFSAFTFQSLLINRLASDLILQILSFFAEQERICIKNRQKEGIAIAKAKGVKFGRRCATLPEDFKEKVKKYNNKEISFNEIINYCNFSKTTFYKYKQIIEA